MSFSDFLRNVKVFDESHGSDSFFYQLAALTIQQHEALEDRHGYLHAAHTPCAKGSLTCAAIKAGEDFKRKHE